LIFVGIAVGAWTIAGPKLLGQDEAGRVRIGQSRTMSLGELCNIIADQARIRVGPGQRHETLFVSAGGYDASGLLQSSAAAAHLALRDEGETLRFVTPARYTGMGGDYPPLPKDLNARARRLFVDAHQRIDLQAEGIPFTVGEVLSGKAVTLGDLTPEQQGLVLALYRRGLMESPYFATLPAPPPQGDEAAAREALEGARLRLGWNVQLCLMSYAPPTEEEPRFTPTWSALVPLHDDQRDGLRVPKVQPLGDEPGPAYKRAVERPGNEITRHEALGLATEAGGLRLVSRLWSEAPPMSLPEGQLTVRGLLEAVAREQQADLVLCEGITVLRWSHAARKEREAAEQAEAVQRVLDLIDGLPGEARAALLREDWLDLEAMPPEYMDAFSATCLPRNPVSIWRRVAEDKELVATVIFDPYVDVEPMQAERAMRRLFLRDRWRFLEFDGLDAGGHEWTLVAVGDGSERRHKSSREPVKWPPFMEGRVCRGGYPPAPQWRYFAAEPHIGCALAGDTHLIGPVLVVRQYLADQQVQSMEGSLERGPLLVRYEVITARDASVFGVDMAVLESVDSAEGKYDIRAQLYWVTLAQESVAPLDGSIISVRHHPERGHQSLGTVGPRLGEVRIDTVQYRVVAGNIEPGPRQENARAAIRSEWRIDGEPRVIGSVTIPVPERNDVLGICDPSTRPSADDEE
jgi:hypothetical protein